MKNAITRVLVSFWLIACFSTRSAAEPTQGIPWTKRTVVGLTLDLVDPTDITWMGFGRSGYVMLTFGKKDGPMCSPADRWKIVSGRLVIGEPSSPFYDELTLLHRDDSKIVLRHRNGKIETYKIGKLST